MIKMARELSGKKGKKGFTLIELLVVIGILAILVLLAAPSFLGYTKDANVAAMQADAKVLSNAALIYHLDENTWPADGTAVTVTIPGANAGNVYQGLDETEVDPHVQSLKNPITEYVIAVEGEDAGTVYHKDGVEDKKGDKQYGVKKQ